MVTHQMSNRDIWDERVLSAMRFVPRHLFIPPDLRSLAYQDCPLPIGANQTISQPYIVAYMTQLLKLKGDETVLEIGTGSGYQAAVLSRLCHWVFTIERIPELAETARNTLAETGCDNVEVFVGDGSLGLPNHAPYAAILVTAAAPEVPQPLLDQLDEGGVLVSPVGGAGLQYLERWTRQGIEFYSEEMAPVAFVPLRGEYGWDEAEWIR